MGLGSRTDLAEESDLEFWMEGFKWPRCGIGEVMVSRVGSGIQT